MGKTKLVLNDGLFTAAIYIQVDIAEMLGSTSGCALDRASASVILIWRMYLTGRDMGLCCPLLFLFPHQTGEYEGKNPRSGFIFSQVQSWDRALEGSACVAELLLQVLLQQYTALRFYR